LDLCARITTGRPMPDGSGAGPPGNVIIIQGEDFADDTVLPRLQTLGADLSRALVFRASLFARSQPFSLPFHAGLVDRALAMNRPRLLVLDPILAFLDRGVFAGSDQSVRRALSPLAKEPPKAQEQGILVPLRIQKTLLRNYRC